MKQLFLLLSLCLWAATAWSTEYFVDSTPPTSAATNCTQAQNSNTPHNTITEGLACLTSGGDVLTIKAGTYPERVLITAVANGTSGNPTIIRGAPGEAVWIKPTTGPSPIVQFGNNRAHIILRNVKISGNDIPDTININGLHTGNSDTDASHHLTLDGIEITETHGDMLIQREFTYGIAIRNSYFHENFPSGGANSSPAGGIYAQATKSGGGSLARNIVEHNTFYKTSGSSISHRNGKGLPMYGLTVRHNRFIESGQIFLDANGVGVEIIGNTFICKDTAPAAGSGAIFRAYVANFIAQHNTFHDCTVDIDRFANQAMTTAQKALWTNNLFSHTQLWETVDHRITTGNYNGVVSGNPLFVTSSGRSTADIQLAAGSPAKGTATGGKDYGAYQTLARSSAQITGKSLVISFTTPGGVLPISECDITKHTVLYAGVPATQLSCTPGIPQTHQVSVVMQDAPAAGQAVTHTWTYNFVKDSFNLGGSLGATLLNDRRKSGILAQSTPQTVTNNNLSSNWQHTTSRIPPPDTGDPGNRVCLLFVGWETQLISPPLNTSACTWGGQTGVEILEQGSERNIGQDEITLAAWYFDEATIAAMSGGDISCTLSETPSAEEPPIYASACFDDVTQTGSPIIDSADGFTGSGVNLSTPSFATTSGGTAVFAALAAFTGTWTGIGAGWSSQLIVTEDSSPSLFMRLGSTATTGADETAAVNRSDPSPMVIVAVALNSAAAPPVQTQSTLVQTASRCASAHGGQPTTDNWWWQTATDNQPCRVKAGKQLALVAQWIVENEAEPTTARAKTFQCCADGVCDEDSDYWLVPDSDDNFQTWPINYVDASAYPDDGTIATNPFTTVPAGGVFVAGKTFSSAAVVPRALLENEFTVQARAVQFSSALTPGTVVKCRMGLDNGQPFNSYVHGVVDTTITIAITQGKAFGL